LKRNREKVVSTTEDISEIFEGIVLESEPNGYLEYYSSDLSKRMRLTGSGAYLLEVEAHENTYQPAREETIRGERRGCYTLPRTAQSANLQNVAPVSVKCSTYNEPHITK